MFARQLLAVLFASAVFAASAQAPIKGEASPGVYNNLQTSPSSGLTSILRVAPIGVDPCESADVVKSGVVLNAGAGAATTQLIALSGSTVIYVCSYVMTISQPGTTANTISFVQGTGANCGTGQSALTGVFGNGGTTAAAPIVIHSAGSGTKFKTSAGNALCITTTTAATANYGGVVSYVQQ